MSFPDFTNVCPACKKEAIDEMVDREVAFLGCAECFGLFVSEDGLEDYVAHSAGSDHVGKAFKDLLQRALDEKAPKPGNRSCPVCKKPLGRMGFGESPFVILDRCDLHGLWLDKKELKKIVRSARAHAAVMGLIPRPRDDGNE